MTDLFVNRLTVIDCSYLDSERGLVGESWQVDIVLHGALDEQGMVLDFGDVKKSVKSLIDEYFDHKLLVPTQYSGTHIRGTSRDPMVHFTLMNQQALIHQSPVDALQLIDCEKITPSTLAPAIVQSLMPHMPSNVKSIDIHLWPEVIDGAFYHYSHGLKHHCGNCQRIAHGHRSRLLIERNGERAPELEAEWTTRWRDIYIGTRSDIAKATPERIDFAYQSRQGHFALSLPSRACYLIDTDSTVENIAQHLAEALKRAHPEDDFRVLAFEGVDKGAIGIA